MSPTAVEVKLDSLAQEVRQLASAVSTSSQHLCYQGETFDQLNTRLTAIETDIKTLLGSRGSSRIIEKLVLLIICAALGLYSGSRAADARVDDLTRNLRTIATDASASPRQEARP